MRTENYNLTRYDADEGKVFDWKDLTAHTYIDDSGVEQQEHLYAKTLFIGDLDSIDNYVEVNQE